MPVADDTVAAAVSATAPAAINTSGSETVAGEQSAATDKSDAKPKSAKDRKPRRERPPLPDPIPTAPVKRIPEPSRAEMLKKTDEHDALIREAFDKLASAKVFFEKRTKIREAGRDEFDAARKRMSQKNDELRAMFDKKKGLTAEIKALRNVDMNARNEAASSSVRDSDALKGLKTVEDVDNRIRDLEYTISVESMPMQQEKKIIAQIAFLKHTGRQIIVGKDQAFQQEKAAKQARMDKRTELETLRKELDKKIDAAKVTLEQFKKEVDGIRSKQDAEINKLAEETQSIDREKVKESISEHKQAIRKLREEFFIELDNWYLNERIHVEQVRIAKRKKWEAQVAEREARRKAWEEEQAQYPEPDPYQKEKDMCSGLTVYLQTLLGETIEKTGTKSLLTKTGVAPSLKNADDSKNSRTISSAGKPIGKSSKTSKAEEFEMLAFSNFMQKKGKAKGKKGRRGSVSAAATESTSATAETLKPHSIDLLAAFTHLEITPPNKMSEVREALDAVKKKKEYYDSDPTPPKPEAASKESAPKVKTTSKPNGKSLAKDMSAGSGAFPGLNGSVDVQKPAGGVSDSSRPSFSDIAKGSAAAPAPNMFAAELGSEVIQEPAIEADEAITGNHDTAVAPQTIPFAES